MHYVSPSVEQTFGYRPGGARRRHLERIVHPDELPAACWPSSPRSPRSPPAQPLSRPSSASATPSGRWRARGGARAPTCSPTRRSRGSCSTCATSPSARPSRPSSSTRPSTTRSPACPTAPCSATASSTRSPASAASSLPVAVLFLDIDDFKNVNDASATPPATIVLQEVAPPPGGLHAPGRHRRPARRRRVRDPDPRGRERAAGDRDRPARDGRRSSGRSRSTAATSRSPRASGSPSATRRWSPARRRRAAAQRRRGDVHGQGERQGPLPGLPARDARPRARPPGAEERPPARSRRRRVHAPLPADHGSRAAATWPAWRRSCAGSTRRAARCSRSTSSRCSRTPA